MASPCTAIGGNTPVLTPNNDPVPTSNGQCDLGPLMECRYERNSRMLWRVVVINKIVSVANVLASNSIIPCGLTISAAYLLHIGVVHLRWPIIYSRQKKRANEQQDNEGGDLVQERVCQISNREWVNDGVIKREALALDPLA